MTITHAALAIVTTIVYTAFMFLLGYNTGYKDAERDQKKKDTQ